MQSFPAYSESLVFQHELLSSTPVVSVAEDDNGLALFVPEPWEGSFWQALQIGVTYHASFGRKHCNDLLLHNLWL